MANKGKECYHEEAMYCIDRLFDHQFTHRCFC